MTQRTIKFRGWSEKTKTMFFYNSWFTLDQGNTLCFEHNEQHHYVDASDVDHPARVVLMQSTGLKDCKGKEIYEGDIISIHGSGINSVGDPDFHRKIVKWIDDEACFYFYQINGERQVAGFTFCANNLRNMEIIGNIYENPDLIPKP